MSRARRRTVHEMALLEQAMEAIVKADPPMTIRQAFYQAVGHDLVEKSEQGYDHVAKAIGRLRWGGMLDWSAIRDNTRGVQAPYTFSGMIEYREHTAQLYQRDHWQTQDTRVVILIEKDALAGVIAPVIHQWQVPLVVTRGDCSDSTLADVAQYLTPDKQNFLYVFSDFDPSGVGSIFRAVERKLLDPKPEPGWWTYGNPASERGFGVTATIKRVALTPAQIKQYKLPTRPTKQGSTQAKSFGSKHSVELDALPPATLRELVTNGITQHVDMERWHSEDIAEKFERSRLLGQVTATDHT